MQKHFLPIEKHLSFSSYVFTLILHLFACFTYSEFTLRVHLRLLIITNSIETNWIISFGAICNWLTVGTAATTTHTKNLLSSFGYDKTMA